MEQGQEDPKIQNLCSHFVHLLLRYLPGMVHLKTLNIKIKSLEDLNLFKKLNTFSQQLSSFKALKIYSLLENPREMPSFLRALIENQNLLQEITHLIIGQLSSEVETFELLPQHCKKLRFLSFETVKTEEYLEILGDFEKLEGVQIYVKDPITLIDAFNAPSSLTLSGGKWAI